MTDLKDFARLVARDHGLCVMSTLRPDSTIQSSLVNAGVLDHPVTGKPVVGLVARGQTRKLANLRARPHHAARAAVRLPATRRGLRRRSGRACPGCALFPPRGALPRR